MHDQIDEELLAAAIIGDREALGILLARHHGSVLGYLYRLVGGDRPLAEDLVQESLLRVLRPGTYLPAGHFKPWLYTIATNLARDHFKSAALRYRGRVEDAEETLLLLHDRAPGPEDSAVAAERGGEVRAALSQLGEEYRVVVILRFYQGFSLQEIAETLQIPLGTVKSRLSVGTHRLRAVLAPMQEGVE